MISEQILYTDPIMPQTSIGTILKHAKSEYEAILYSADKNVQNMSLNLSQKLKQDLGGTWFVFICEPESFSSSIPYGNNCCVMFRLGTGSEDMSLDYLITKIKS